MHSPDRFRSSSKLGSQQNKEFDRTFTQQLQISDLQQFHLDPASHQPFPQGTTIFLPTSYVQWYMMALQTERVFYIQ